MPGTQFRYAYDRVFLSCVGLYFFNRQVIKPGSWGSFTFFHSYLNDFICIPFWLPPLLFSYRWLGLRDHDRPPTYGEIVLHLALWSVLFEVVGPRLGGPFSRSVADPWDIFFYSLGALAAGAVWHVAGRNSVTLMSWRRPSPREVPPEPEAAL